MKRKTIFAVMISLLLVLLVITVVGAQNIRHVDADTYWDANAASTTVRGGLLNVAAEGSGPSCTLTRAGLIQWNVSDINDTSTVGSAKITLQSLVSTTGTDGTSVLALFEAPDNWDDTTPQGSLPTPPPITDTPLATANGPFTVGGSVIFSATGTSDPLIQYIQNQITGDNTVSFWVEITAGCNPGGTGRVLWDSKEAGSATLELSDTNAVTLSSFSASDGQINWSLIAGLFALVAVVVVGIGYGVRRSKQS